MSKSVKFLIGLVAILLMGWIWHGPAGNGERFIAALEAQARAAVAETEVPNIQVRLSRDPLARAATLSGPADRFQRTGQGSLKGLNQIVADIPGVSRVQWADEPQAGGRTLPLLLETLLLLAAAYLIGVIIGRLLFGRRKDTYL